MRPQIARVHTNACCSEAVAGIEELEKCYYHIPWSMMLHRWLHYHEGMANIFPVRPSP